MIGCSCDVCTSADIKNKRRRCSLYVVTEGQHLVFDTPPDFRDQVLSFGVERVDAVFLTHPHADHIFGFDDVRRFSTLQEQHIPVYGAPETIRLMRTKFEYVDRSSYGFFPCNMPFGLRDVFIANLGCLWAIADRELLPRNHFVFA